MTPQELESWIKVALTVGGALAGTFGTWVLMRHDVADLKKWREEEGKLAREERAERERQQEAWWDVVDKLDRRISDLDKTCSNATTRLESKVESLTGRVDLHSTTTVTSLPVSI